MFVGHRMRSLHCMACYACRRLHGLGLVAVHMPVRVTDTAGLWSACMCERCCAVCFAGMPAQQQQAHACAAVLCGACLHGWGGWIVPCCCACCTGLDRHAQSEQSAAAVLHRGWALSDGCHMVALLVFSATIRPVTYDQLSCSFECKQHVCWGSQGVGAAARLLC